MYFKVTDEQMRSLYHADYYGHGAQYRIGKMVRPTVGRLFAYSLEHLDGKGFLEFPIGEAMLPLWGRRLFICQCLFPRHTTVYIRRPMSLGEYDVGALLTKEETLINPYTAERKVVLASGIKLVREVSCTEFREFITDRKELLSNWRAGKS